MIMQCGLISSVLTGFQRSTSRATRTKTLKAQSHKIGSGFNATSANFLSKVLASNVTSKTARDLSM